jgi:hypothetical protein
MAMSRTVIVILIYLPHKPTNLNKNSRVCSHFDIKRIALKEFILAGQTVNSAYYCEVLWWLHEDFAPNFGDKRTGCCITTMHQLTLPFSPGNFWT